MANNNYQPGFRPPKQEVLKENETISSFTAWQSSLLYYLSENDQYARFHDPRSVWQRKSVVNRGLVDDDEPIPEADRKTAVQKNIILQRMLDIILSFLHRCWEMTSQRRARVSTGFGNASGNTISSRSRKLTFYVLVKLDGIPMNAIRDSVPENSHTLGW